MATRISGRTGATRALLGALTVAGLLLAGAPRVQADSDGGAVKFWETGSSVHWNQRAIGLFRARGGNPGRGLAYLSLAQYRAVRAALSARGDPPHPSPAGAAAGASVEVLKVFYPLDAAALEAELAAQAAASRWPGEQTRDFAAGVALGRQVGAAVLALASTDGFGALSPGVPPVGPGRWVSSGAPIVRGGYGARPFFITHGSQLLAPPPPEFGSAAFLAALTQVRGISDTRTAEQLAIARRWVPFSAVVFNEVATDLIVKHRRSELEAARILAYANTATFDAIVGCFYTKFHYWYIRPSQADPVITTPVGLPNHPSYPSAHSCETGAFEVVLGDAFPSERGTLAELAAEANVSRIYAGLHYWFDGSAGLEIGRTAGRLALERQGLE